MAYSVTYADQARRGLRRTTYILLSAAYTIRQQHTRRQWKVK